MGTPILVVNPREDSSFVELCERLMSDSIATPAELEAALRHRFPDAVVRARDLSSESADVWYVYRDGRWINPRPRRR